ncbi:MAG: hypothetical protein R3E96_16985 [Planctomycetota bacterium]
MQRWMGPGALVDFAKLEKDLRAWQSEIGEDGLTRHGLGPLVAALEEHLTAGKRRHRKQLGQDLKTACSTAGLPLKVISREDPVELRIPPLAVRLDLESGRAEILFARQVLDQCPADVTEILACRARALAGLEGEFDAAAFFERCWNAYRAGLAATGGKLGDRLELLDFMAQMALQMQGRKFQIDPARENYRGYTRGQFAFDVNRLRLARGLQQGGKRINFGVATGTAATKKDRVIYMEDENGQGEYKLNVFFSEVPA